MLRKIRSWFAWQNVRDNGVWLYQRNAITGMRRAVKISGCHQPLDFEWLTADVLPARVLTPYGSELIHKRWIMPSPPRAMPARPSR